MKKKEIIALKTYNLDLFELPQTNQSETFTQETQRLPEIDELYSLFDKFNSTYFKNQLPGVKIEWSQRLKTAGKYIYNDRIIRLGRKYHEYYPDEVEDTLKHEMIHILHPNHGREFKSLANSIGASRHAKDYPGGHNSYKYIYICPVCGELYYRRKRLRMASCGSCSGGKYNSRYKLKLFKSITKKDNQNEV